MSIDKTMNQLLDIFDFFNQKNDSEEIEVNKKFIYNNKSNTLKVIIPPRGEGHLFVTDYLIKRLNKNKYSCLSYYFDGELLKESTEKTLENFRKIIITTFKRIFLV
ncbi:TPA: hypothetical protein DIC38_01850 [Candidatus Nomurabacteria bacterium]|nr:MAG: hypothetical protein O210_OD1C00001G0360 [Parcubacteria bacterium RAAC4_OD1_1]HCY26403.1 hypothetical protein [Candidatus Nomurabacteria bacterium]